MGRREEGAWVDELRGEEEEAPVSTLAAVPDEETSGFMEEHAAVDNMGVVAAEPSTANEDSSQSATKFDPWWIMFLCRVWPSLLSPN